MTIDERLVREAIALARQARAEGNHPFGALLALDGRILLTARNTVVTDRNPTAHAEANLIDNAIRQLSTEQLQRSVLYSSCEPCAMCAGKMYWAGIRSLVYALAAEELATLAGRRFLVPCRELFSRASDVVTVEGPVAIAEARKVHLGFWESATA